MVQLFQRYEEKFQLIQTMDDHVGAVVQLLFTDDGEKLLSSSADRTILIRDRVIREVDGETAVAYIISKVITLKASPISMTLLPDNPDTLIVSTMDRSIQKFDITSGRPIHSFRAADSDTTGDTVVMDCLTVAAEVPGQSPKLLVGVSSTDKSIRVYDFERNILLAGEFGHAEGVADALLLESDCPDKSPKRTLISAGMDGIVMIWNLSVQPQQLQDFTQINSRGDEDTSPTELTASKPPLRRILSKTELAVFQRQDSLPTTPTPVRQQSPPLVRKKLSRYNLAPPLKNSNLSTPSPPTSTRRTPVSYNSTEKLRRSPSPVSPKSSTPKKPSSASNNHIRRSSLDIRSRSKSHGKAEFGSLGMSTEQVCRTLRAYRKKLNGSPDHLQSQKDLERELNLTLRVLKSRNARCENVETETDSSGKENQKLHVPALIHRAPSTPNLNQKESARKVSRSRSLDADGEG